jgi:glycosyltransferase involved in cell wall biosynthesis
VGAPDYAATSSALANLPHKVRVAPYGIDLTRYSLPDRSAPSSRAGVLFAGRLTYYKGVEVLLAAAAQIDAPITIAGDGPWRARLEAAARRCNLGERVGALNRQGQPAIVYFHPWEFDPVHPILRTDVLWLARRTHYHRLARTRSVLAALLNDFTWDPLR